MSTERETPETDAAMKCADCMGASPVVHYLISRKLERERDLARQELANAREDRDIWKRRALRSEVEG